MVNGDIEITYKRSLSYIYIYILMQQEVIVKHECPRRQQCQNFVATMPYRSVFSYVNNSMS